MGKFNEWVKRQSKEGFVDFGRIVDHPKNTNEKIGFFVKFALSDRYSDVIRYTIKAGISYNDEIPNCNFTIYDTSVNINYSTKKAILLDNVVLLQYRGQGIGSLGLDYIKYFCKTQKCICISGHKNPIPNTPEEMAKLTAFYAKNGFENLPGDNILYKF